MIILVELVQRQLFAGMLQNRCIKHLWKSDILSKDAGRTCIFTWNVTLAKVFFNYFANKNQLPGLSVSGTLVENVFNSNFAIFIGKHPCTRFPANIAINFLFLKKILGSFYRALPVAISVGTFVIYWKLLYWSLTK